MIAHVTGRVAGVNSSKGLIGLFSWRTAGGTVEMFPDGALTVFDDVLTAEDIDGTSWGGDDAYAAATGGDPLYYFYWNEAKQQVLADLLAEDWAVYGD